jgi:anti-sigma-K factor RskA
MRCEELQDNFELYSLGLLDPGEKEEIDAHLARGCATCQGNLRDALAVSALVMSSTPQVVPPSRLKRRLLASVGVQRAGWGWLGALAAACMLVVALWFSLEERRRATELAEVRTDFLELSAERDRLSQALNFLNRPETRQVIFGAGQPEPPRGNVLVNPQLGVLLIASNLPPLAAGRTYEMWVIPPGAGAAPRPAGLFQSTSDGTALHVLSGPLDLTMLAAVAVSVEPESGSPAPTTTPIIVAPVRL